MFTLNIVEYWYYCKRTWINVLVTIMNVIGMYSLIMASYHYSIDVLCAFIFSLMFWAIYHWAISIPELGSTWWGDIINYIDDPFFYEHAELPVTYGIYIILYILIYLIKNNSFFFLQKIHSFSYSSLYFKINNNK